MCRDHSDKRFPMRRVIDYQLDIMTAAVGRLAMPPHQWRHSTAAIAERLRLAAQAFAEQP